MRNAALMLGLLLLTGLGYVLWGGRSGRASSAPRPEPFDLPATAPVVQEAALARASRIRDEAGDRRQQEGIAVGVARAALMRAAAQPLPEQPVAAEPAASHGMPYHKLAERYASETVDPEWTRNSVAMAESFLTEAGLDPETLTRVECRQTLCKIELKSGLPMDKILSVTGELEHAGIPVSAQFDINETGTLNVQGAFLPKEGFEHQIQSVTVKPHPEPQAAVEALEDDGRE